WSRDGQMLLHAGRENVRLYDATGSKVLHQFAVANHLNWHAELSPDGRWLATASFDSRAYVLDAHTGEELARMALGRPGRVAAFSPDNRLLAVGGRGGIMQIYATESWELLHRLAGVEKDFYNACFHPDGRRLATASLDMLARLWDASTGEVLVEYADHEEGVMAVSFASNGTQVVTASTDRFWRVFDTESGQLIRRFENPGTYLHDLAVSPDNRLVATADNNGVCRLWDFASGEILATLQAEPPLVKVAFDPTGTRIVCNSFDSTRIVSVARLVEDPRLAPVLSSRDAVGLEGRARVYGVPVSRDTAWGAREQTWNSPAGLTRADVLDHSFGIIERYADWSPDNSMRVQYSFDAMSASVFDNASTDVLHVFPPAQWYDARFSPDGRHLAMAQGNGQIEVFETATWQSVARTLPKAPADTPAVGNLNGIAFDTAGRRLAMSFLSGHAFIWDFLGTDAPLAMERTDTAVLCIAFRPDGAVLAGGTGGRNVVFWDAENGTTLARIPGHKSSVVGMAFSPDGRRLVSFANRADIRIWDAVELRQILMLRDLNADNAPLAIGFTSDGLHLFAVTQQREVLFFEGFPWDPNALPGGSASSLPDRLELHKRRTRLGSLP
ncbi:MAG: WD40 repeat domain-containing protein, partial [Candidatus Sumerlaeia bacterium]|nr:WD40 repeat domain-containing protein [Candidatus Sumerlaeia bacterium]